MSEVSFNFTVIDALNQLNSTTASDVITGGGSGGGLLEDMVTSASSFVTTAVASNEKHPLNSEVSRVTQSFGFARFLKIDSQKIANFHECSRIFLNMAIIQLIGNSSSTAYSLMSLFSLKHPLFPLPTPFNIDLNPYSTLPQHHL